MFDEAMSLKLKPEQLQRINIFVAAYRVWQVGVLREAPPLCSTTKDGSSTSCSSANCSVVLVISPVVSLTIDQSTKVTCSGKRSLALSLPLS